MTKKKTVAVNVTLEADVDKALQKHMKAQNLTNRSRAINDGLKYALYPEHRDGRSEDLVKLYHQILYSLNEHRKKTARDLAANQEIMLQFMLDYYANTPASGKRDPEAQKRLDNLMEVVVRNLGKSKIMQELEDE